MVKISFENGQISNFEELVTLTLTLDRAILHTIMHHSLTSTYMPNLIENEETFCGQMDVWTDRRIHRQKFETGFIRSTLPQIHMLNIQFAADFISSFREFLQLVIANEGKAYPQF